MKISKKWKKNLEISSFSKIIPKIMIIGYTIPEIWHVTDVIVTLDYFLPIYPPPPNSPKNENFKKIKQTAGYIIILHSCAKNCDRMLYCSWDTAHDTCNFYFPFWAIFCPFTPLTDQKIKISKKWKKKTWRYHHFKHVYQKLWLDNAWFLRYGVRRTGGQTNRRTDEQTEKVTYRGGCPT